MGRTRNRSNRHSGFFFEGRDSTGAGGIGQIPLPLPLINHAALGGRVAPEESQIDLSILRAIKFLSCSSSYRREDPSRVFLAHTRRAYSGRAFANKKSGKQFLPHKSACVPRAHLAAREISPSSSTRRDGRARIYRNIYYILRRRRRRRGGATPYDSVRARVLCLSPYCLLPFCICTCYRRHSSVYFPRRQRGK